MFGHSLRISAGQSEVADTKTILSNFILKFSFLFLSFYPVTCSAAFSGVIGLGVFGAIYTLPVDLTN